MPNKHQHWRNVADGLQELNGLISNSERLRYFEESLDANELGIALHALCDSLLEDNTSLVDDATINKIDSLHQLMAINDDCVKKLREKAPRA